MESGSFRGYRLQVSCHRWISAFLYCFRTFADFSNFRTFLYRLKTQGARLKLNFVNSCQLCLVMILRALCVFFVLSVQLDFVFCLFFRTFSDFRLRFNSPYSASAPAAICKCQSSTHSATCSNPDDCDRRFVASNCVLYLEKPVALQLRHPRNH
jgi:hypothetical protein